MSGRTINYDPAKVPESEESRLHNNENINNRYNKALLLLKGNTPKNGIKELKEIAPECPDAANMLGDIYRNGLYGEIKNIPSAIQYYKMAAASNHIEAACSLAVLYITDDNPQNDKEGIKYMRLAAQGGNPTACSNLGFIYEKGKYGERVNEKEALKWYRKGAELKDGPSEYGLGKFYENGMGGLAIDLNRAANLYDSSDGHNYMSGTAAIGRCYLYGIGRPKKEDLGLQYITKAANAENSSGMFLMGVIYEKGLCGKKKDIAVAKKWYEKASKKGNKEAADALMKLGLTSSVPEKVTRKLVRIKNSTPSLTDLIPRQIAYK